MSRQELSYFDIVPQWQTSVQSQRGTGVQGSPNSISTIEAMDESDSDSDDGNGASGTGKKATVPAKRRQALQDERITREEMNKLESRLNRATVLCTSLFCINIAISGVMFLNFMRKQ
ncbi:hypothetical protein FPANT_11497 [Fusarium pseudoanthophilum]|uniref:Uncharacterized protein n=1 Tax=Fusarium pseudoanthophilum TaxID=48495 RepID=A0A8H5NS90_9HYPO|nr:hypothetical protein FPANT_11497 [Fusarium pseudoanthophilum]